MKENSVIGGLVASILLFAIGAFMDFAVTVSPYQQGFSVKTMGAILIILGATGMLVSLIFAFVPEFTDLFGRQRHRRSQPDTTLGECPVAPRRSGIPRVPTGRVHEE